MNKSGIPLWFWLIPVGIVCGFAILYAKLGGVA